MKTLNTTLTALAIAVTLMGTSCKKKDTTPTPATVTDSDTNGANDNSTAEKTSDDVSNIGGQVSESASSTFRTAPISCATVTYDTLNTTKTFTITFSGTCGDGHTRSGSLVFDFSGSTNGAKHYRHPGYKAVVTSVNYIVDGAAVTINKTIMNTTIVPFDPTVTNLTWTESDNTTIVKAGSTGTITWVSNKTKTLLNTSDNTVYHGPNTAISWDLAKRGITGTTSGTTSDGVSFTASTSTQLVRDFTCSPYSSLTGYHPFISGTLMFTPGTKATRYIDYGYPNNGACDDSAEVTINKKVFPVKI